ncbi:MAG TPA: type II secretion system protein GspG [Candidatus Polarisedimenticolia bacterium]|nr:type II secretion system protein GspG [Candidatus Polarisedimenticolia bacterium]
MPHDDRKARRRRQAGFTLIELLIVVTIIGIIAALAFPNLRAAMDRAKQKATMANMRGIGNALEMYSVDHNTYPRGLNDAGSAALGPILSPAYMRTVPPTDEWNNPWHIDTNPTGSQYTITSFGRDGAPGSNTGGVTSDINCDIVYTNSAFFQYPGGQQN